MSLVSLCGWHVQVSVYCARRIPAHLMCTQCSILLILIDICFLTCICLWQISQIQTCLRVVVGPGLVLTSPAFMRSSASDSVCPYGRPAQRTVNWAGGVITLCIAVCQTTVTAPSRVCCVVWSRPIVFYSYITRAQYIYIYIIYVCLYYLGKVVSPSW